MVAFIHFYLLEQTFLPEALQIPLIFPPQVFVPPNLEVLRHSLTRCSHLLEGRDQELSSLFFLEELEPHTAFPLRLSKDFLLFSLLFS